MNDRAFGSQFPRPRMQEIGGDGSDVGAPGARVAMTRDYELCGVRLKDVYRDADGELWEVIALCDKPQATFRRVSNPLKQVDHVIGCRNMTEQFPSGPLRAAS